MKEDLKVLVASQNKVKQLAVEDAFGIFTKQPSLVEMSTQPIDSNVSLQPLELEETALGALNRLSAILQMTSGYDYYVAIEGGAYKVDLPKQEQWYESACAAISKNDCEPVIAYGPAYPIPSAIAKHLPEGKDLTQAMENETGIADIGNREGFNGWLTDGQLDRRTASSQAVLLALYGLVKAEKQHE
jgi:inosine/xanthosine triphosphatase